MKKTTIRRKLLVSILSLLSIQYLVTGIFTSFYVYSLLIEQANQKNRQILVQAIQQLDIGIQMCDMTARQIMTDLDLDQIVKQARNGVPSQKYIIISRANELLKRYITLNPFIANIAIITSDQIVLSNQEVFLSDLFLSRCYTKWFRDFIETKTLMSISDQYETTALGRTQKVVTLLYKYKNFSPKNDFNNYLMIDIPTVQLQNLLQSDGAYPSILVVNQAEQTVVTSNLLSLEELHKSSSQNNMFRLKSSIALYQKMESIHWHFYYPIPYSEFNRPITLLLAGYITLYLLIFGLCIVILSKRIGKIIAPVHTITTTMQAAFNGNINVSTHIKSDDELEILSDCFNKLIQDLQKKIYQIIVDEDTKKQMQLDLLISQIHPHFIYNTLHSAVYLIEENKSETAIEIIYSLIYILQDVVRIGSQEIFTTIEDELKLVRCYTNISSIRYPEAFQIHIFCDNLLLKENIPKVLIQPLIENALIHGILPSGKPGIIWVKITISSPLEEWMDICVEDNGVGLKSTNIEDMIHIPTGHSPHGVGLLNIHNRLRFLYQANGFEFSILPKQKGGTKILIRLPRNGFQENTS